MSDDTFDNKGRGRQRNGGVPARRAMMRWAWRMFRREWRQQLLVLSLVVFAVAATIVGAAVATNNPPPAGAGFGTAHYLVSYSGYTRGDQSQVATLRQRYGRVDIIENQTNVILGSVDTFQIRAQDPRGAYGRPMLALLSGSYPANANEVALTSGVANTFNVKVGDTWRYAGVSRRVVGIVENPQNLVDAFALVVPGQVRAPSEVTVLFDAHGVDPAKVVPSVVSRARAVPTNVFNPETISLAGVTIGMLLIALVAIGGFTVLAQRRLRSLGMVESLGATDDNVALVVRTNGLVVGLVGALIGLVLGLAVWFAYRPSLEASAHHVIGVMNLPWLVVVLAMVLAVVATYFAATRPARSIARVPIVAALSGRPAPPKQIRRSAIPGLVSLGISFLLLADAGRGNGNGSSMLALVFGLVALVASVILLSPFCLAALSKIARRAPVSARLSLRELSRYRARSGSAVSAISLGVLIAMLISVLSAARFGNVLDYAGPNVAPNQVVVHTGTGPGFGGPFSKVPPPSVNTAATEKAIRQIAGALGSSQVLPLESAQVILRHNAAGRQWTGSIYVATAQLLKMFNIAPSSISPSTDIITMRPGLSGLSKMQLLYGNGPASGAISNPVIEEVGGLPSGTSAPNTAITEQEIARLHLSVNTTDWLIETRDPPTIAQIRSARLAAGSANLSIETKSSMPSSSQIISWATAFGIVLALGILAMSIGLIRSETAGDRRTLAATGASGMTRRNLSATTAGTLALIGAVIGTAMAYVAAASFSSGSRLDGPSSLTSVPVTSLLVMLVGMPLAASFAGWLFSNREPSMIARRPME